MRQFVWEGTKCLERDDNKHVGSIVGVGIHRGFHCECCGVRLGVDPTEKPEEWMDEVKAKAELHFRVCHFWEHGTTGEPHHPVHDRPPTKKELKEKNSDGQ